LIRFGGFAECFFLPGLRCGGNDGLVLGWLTERDPFRALNRPSLPRRGPALRFGGKATSLARLRRELEVCLVFAFRFNSGERRLPLVLLFFETDLVDCFFNPCPLFWILFEIRLQLNVRKMAYPGTHMREHCLSVWLHLNRTLSEKNPVHVSFVGERCPASGQLAEHRTGELVYSSTKTS